MGGKSAPAQPTTKTDMGQFGYTTTGGFGSKWGATPFQKSFITSAENRMNNANKALEDRTVSQERVQAMQNQFNQDFRDKFIAPAMQKGLLRGSTAADVYNMGQKAYAQQAQNLIDQEEQRQYQALANALANYTTMFDIAQGTTGLSNAQNQAASNYALSAAQLEAANQQATMGNIMNGLQTAAGAAMMFSDIRLKENIEKLDIVEGINIYKFDYINGEKDQVGVIAQEIQEEYPECVITREDGYLAVDYSKLPQAVQERIEELK